MREGRPAENRGAVVSPNGALSLTINTSEVRGSGDTSKCGKLLVLFD